MRTRAWVCLIATILGVLLLGAVARAQVNTVNLSGTVVDPQNLAVVGAKVTVKLLATGAERTATTDGDGHYEIVGLTPGTYSVKVEAKNFAVFNNPELVLTLGATADYNPRLSLQGGQQTVEVSGTPEVVDTTKSATSDTVTQLQINELPINGRSYINFTLINSQAARDDAPSIGAAPTSGLNFGGQRARSNDVTVDGADAVDNSVNGIRSTVSQEAVQEFQLILSNYMPEYGKATGGVINIVTKSGSNETHGDLFGFLRQKSFQAQDPFSLNVNPVTGAVTPVKQAFTRVEAGATIGGPIQKDKTFYFFSYELTRRQETGFNDIGTGNFGLAPFAIPCTGFPALLMTPQQGAFYGPTISFLTGNGANCASAPAQPVIQAALVTGGASATALFGNAPGGPKTFPLPIDCDPRIPGNCGLANIVPLPGSFVPLTSLIGNYPIKEGTSQYSMRLDHVWNPHNTTFVRGSVSPSLVTGVQVTAQNQAFGQNAGSRTSLNQFRDLAIVAQHDTTISDTLFNEARFQFARRGLHYGFSQLPGGSAVAVNIPGFAFFGREPFSTVDRIERRDEFTDNVTVVRGHHTIKFGGDFNLIQIRSNKPQVFELDFGGRFDFGALPGSLFGFPPQAGPFNPVQAYGLGFPGDFIQGVGAASAPFNNPTLGVFLQDSWRLNSRLTLNYGVRYDIEWTPTFQPATVINQAAEQALGMVEGIPVDPNNIAPRFGFAWDPTGSGKTVIRGNYGIFYDHPLLAVAFDSTTADGARSVQLQELIGNPSRQSIATSLPALNASSIFQGVLNTTGLPGVTFDNNQQRFDPFNSPFLTNQNFLTAGFPLGLLPFTFPVNRNFVYAYAQQAGLGIERELGSDWKIGVEYNWTKGTHLNRPRNPNVPDPTMIMLNFRNALAGGQTIISPSIIIVGNTSTPGNMTTCGVNVLVPGVIGVLAGCPPSLLAQVPNLNGQIVATTPVFNFFRPSGPNPSFGFAQLEGLIGAFHPCFAPGSCIPAGPGVPIPFASVDSQESSGSSNYNALTLTISKRFSRHIEFLSNWTWSHAIDDSTDLQSLLEPQDSRFPGRDRSNSTFDQRNRWVTSAVFESPYKQSDSGFLHKFLANFTVSPILELSSGRPFNILVGSDVNQDFQSNTDRPSVVPVGTPGSVQSPFIKNVAFFPATKCDTIIPPLTVGGVTTPISPPFGCTGNLGRNAFTSPGFFDLDMRISRRVPITERFSLEVIADAFNLLNRFNAADVSPLCDPTGSGACNAGQPTADLGMRQFQFGLKVNF
ncbi:MAG: TonB-dependent receptor domain-containing protein [Candidatus Acidiferrales bacterium]